jgi:hypothetical protein
VQCLTLLVLYPDYTTTKDTKSTKEEKKHLEIRSLSYSGCPFFVSFVRFVVNSKALVKHHGGRCAAYQRDDNLQ